MQFRNYLILIFTLFSGLVLLTSCAAPLVSPKGKLKTPDVRIHVARDLHITTSGGGNCKAPNDNNPNCIKVPEYDQAKISFALTPATGWRFSEFIVCVGNTKTTGPCNLNKYQQAEFEASVSGGTVFLNPDAHGVIELWPFSPVLTEAFTAFQVLDKNWVANDYFYNIKICPTEDPEVEENCMWLDPPISNGGKGGSN